nr:glycoside hydrolase family 2 [Sunxiuqinia sp.]
MKRISLITQLLCLMALLSCQNNRAVSDGRIPFDFDWKFALDDHPGAEQLGFDDSEWRLLDVPHDFSIEHPFDSTNATAAGGGYTYSGIGWYRKTFTTEPNFSNKQVWILFDGMYRNSEVWINEESLGIRPYGYSSFYYDLKPHLN